MIRTRLIWPALMLSTGFTAPAVCQVNTSEGYGHGLARTLAAYPSCVYEQVPYPWGPLGLGDIHEWGDCIEDTLLAYAHSGGPSPCWAWAWGVIDPTTPNLFSYTVWWAADGTLTSVGVKARDGIFDLGSWENLDPADTLTWTQHRYGSPIVHTVRWSPIDDWWIMPILSNPALIGEDEPAYPVFVNYYGLRPWDAALEVRIDWIDPLCPQEFRGGQHFGGRSRLTVQVVPDPMPADYNRDGACNGADVFAFLADWFRGWVRADWDASGGCEAADIFAFLSDWFGETR